MNIPAADTWCYQLNHWLAKCGPVAQNTICKFEDSISREDEVEDDKIK